LEGSEFHNSLKDQFSTIVGRINAEKHNLTDISCLQDEQNKKYDYDMWSMVTERCCGAFQILQGLNRPG
jgi:hypothetical protein